MKQATYHNIASFLLKPLKHHFLFLLALFVFLTIPYLFLPYIFGARLYIAAHCFLYSYLITLIVSLIKPIAVRRIVQIIIMVVITAFFVVNSYCCIELGYRIDADIVSLIQQTDSNETSEFLSGMLPKGLILFNIAVFLFFFILWLVSRRQPISLGRKYPKVVLAGLGCCTAFAAYCWEGWEDGPLYFFKELKSFENIDDLRPYYKKPSLIANDTTAKSPNVVLIIGESFSRCHSSLYGYEKVTNPRLSVLKDNSLLFTFDDINSAYSTTSNSIKLMMSTYSKADKAKPNSKKWYECTNIIQLMQECGYQCCWFSNQARWNKNNNTARLFGDACDKQWLLQQEGGSNKVLSGTDMVLVDSSYQFVNHMPPQESHFIVYHMIGSHFTFSRRYPHHFAHFTSKDYESEPQEHRTLLATYDNSILYNDFVVSRIIDLFKDKEAIILYVPDHGQVMFRNPNDPDYYAHGNTHDRTSYALGVQIPFIIYASPLFQQRHPETMQRIKYRQDHPKNWDTDDLPYLIMDLIGVVEIDGESTKKSLLN